MNKPYCAECVFLKDEHMDGYGICSVLERQQHCSDQCGIVHNCLSINQTNTILHYAQKWRRGANIKQISPYVLGMGIDAAIYHLRNK